MAIEDLKRILLSPVLFRLDRDTGKISFDFAYEGKRWEVTPRNVGEIVAALRG